MDIKRAKDEIKDTIEAYLLKDEFGDYLIPLNRQRPILLLGAPGIGKTQIMEQIARECGIGLVAYTITHHTRQSAIGLPFVSEKEFGGKKYTITEYTMSEIVASIYNTMEETGLKEGILFIDEINCVSETLAPTMLQFLQYKTFGNHEIPKGWVIVTAGNPPEYNKSVREFDVVTMDRLKKIEVSPNYSVWKEYALREQIHPAVISYLDARPASFYKMETTVDGMRFATPRGWEDLSTIIQVYEKLGKKTDRDVVVQYIQHETIAKDFAAYLELYYKYQTDYQIDEVLNGHIDETLLKKASNASFDERLSLVSLLLSRCSRCFADLASGEDDINLLYDQLKIIRENIAETDILTGCIDRFNQEYILKKKADLLSSKEDKRYRHVLEWLERCRQDLKLQDISDPGEAFSFIITRFDHEQDLLDQDYATAGQHIEHAFDFIEAAFGSGQEMVIFVTDLNTDYYSIRFLKQYNCERYYHYNRELLIDEKSRSIEERLERLKF